MTPSLPVVEPLQRALHLRSLDLFSNLSAHELTVFARLMREQWLRRGEVLYSAGQQVRAVHLLVEGQVRLERDGQAVGRVAAPEGVGLIELLAQVEPSTRAVAATNALALVIDGNAFFDVIEDHFPLFLQLRSALGRQVRGLRHRLGPGAAWPPPTVSRPGPLQAASMELVEQLIWLHRTPELRNFGAGVLAALVRDQGVMRLAPGEMLWADDAEAQYLALVVDGVVRCGDESRGGFRAGTGTLLGLDAAFAGTPHDYGAVAESAVLAIRIDVPVLLDVAEDHFHVAGAMLAYCARMLLRLQAYAADTTDGEAPADAGTEPRRGVHGGRRWWNASTP